jgi:hypothetical protein
MESDDQTQVKVSRKVRVDITRKGYKTMTVEHIGNGEELGIGDGKTWVSCPIVMLSEFVDALSLVAKGYVET